MSGFQKISIISFTAAGAARSIQIGQISSLSAELEVSTKCKKTNIVPYESSSLSDWTQKNFIEHRAMIFIGAVGIAVRSIAPYLKDKLSDPPVLVVDELGNYVIPILSGHVGGANELAKLLAKELGAQAILTTATDLNKTFAVDLFAKKNQLILSEKSGIVKVSSKILAKEKVPFSCSGEIRQDIPEELIQVPYPPKERISFLISPYESYEGKESGKADLQLIPRCIVVGIGCKRGKNKNEIQAAVQMQLKKYKIDARAICEITSIERKKDELGILELAKEYGVPFTVFSEEQLRQVEGDFAHSDFVQRQVGVDNVCARSAMAACERKGKLIADKWAYEGVTVALAEKKWSVMFE